MRGSPAALHRASPVELKARLEADRAGAPYLLYRDGDGRQRLDVLPADRERLVVGRSAVADISLTWDSEASRAHAQLERVGHDWAVVDDGLSRNGTFVNGERSQGRRRLRDGDELRVGDTVMVFRAPAAAEETTALARDAPDALRISQAQRRVLVALCRPFADGSPFATPASNQQIAAELVVSVESVKTHLRALFQRLEVEALPQNQKRARLVERAFQLGLVSSRDLGGRDS
jgi:DNA-binding CsgD family transcriptional regulator